MKLKTFRYWDSAGKHQDVQASTVEFSKKKDGLMVTFDQKKKVKGVTALIEIAEPAVINQTKVVVDED